MTKRQVKTIEVDAGYYKQGDDWQDYLDEHEGSKGIEGPGGVPLALRAWAADMRASAARLEALAAMVEQDRDAHGEGGAHSATITTKLAGEITANADMPIKRWVDASGKPVSDPFGGEEEDD